LGSKEALRRFLQESDLTQKLQHPNIIHVYESGGFQVFILCRWSWWKA
jgi:hypothetical protein